MASFSGSRFRARNMGTCLSYSSSGTDNVNLGNIAVGSAFTYSIWVFFPTVHKSGSTFQNLIRKDTPIIIDLNNDGRIEFAVHNGTSYDAMFSTTATWYPGWHHIAFTSERKIYINGILDNTGSAITPVSTSANMYIGNTSSSLLSKRIDEFAVYSRALSQEEIQKVCSGSYPASGLSNLYLFDEGSGATAVDQIGGANGTITGASYSTDVFFKNRSAMSGRRKVENLANSLNFAAGTNRVNITSVAAQNNLTQSSSAAWIFVRGAGGNNAGRFFHKANTAAGWHSCYVASSGTINFSAAWSGANALWVGSNFKVGEWMFVVWTYDNTSTSNNPVLYVNGVSQNVTVNTAPSGTVTADDANMCIGNRSSDNGRGFDGYISKLMYFNKVLSQAEVTLLYQGQIPSGLIAYHKLDEGSGTTTIDQTGNANGSITGATYSTNVPFKSRSAI